MTASEQTDTQIDLIWLSEPDMIEAGVTDTAKCVETMEETLVLLDKGDYRMAGHRRIRMARRSTSLMSQSMRACQRMARIVVSWRCPRTSAAASITLA